MASTEGSQGSRYRHAQGDRRLETVHSIGDPASQRQQDNNDRSEG
jgi:hypothetical protein